MQCNDEGGTSKASNSLHVNLSFDLNQANSRLVLFILL